MIHPDIRRAVPFVLTMLLCAVPAFGEIAIERPGQREFVVDRAALLTPEQEQQIRQTADQLLTAKAAPLIVVTIPSMDAVGVRNRSIERFAGQLFDQWQIGYEKWNNGILLVVSPGDRKARIELGADWGRSRNEQTQYIMNELMVPHFAEYDFATGILAGVEALDAMARELELPKPKRPMWHYLAIIGFIGLMIFTVVSLIRRGSGGWAWLFWAVVFGILGTLLYHLMTSRGSSGGFGGGSFGGGFSGGGGATGSW